MSVRNIPICPPSLKQIQHYLKAASEHDNRDIVVAYWCRLYALQLGLKIDRSSQEAKKLLGFLMDWLEKTKAEQSDNEAICNDIAAQAHLENYALRLFVWADSQDRAGTVNKNVVKAFYTAGIIFDVLDTFGESSEEVLQNKKYAKWKAAYIHNCMKNGEIPIPGPVGGEDENPDEPSSSSTARLPSLRRPFSQSIDISQSNFAFPWRSSTMVQDPIQPVEPKKAEFEAPDDAIKPIHQEKKTSEGVHLSPEQMTKAQKYCKWAASALNYDDVPTAVTNLQKALQLLTTGVDE